MAGEVAPMDVRLVAAFADDLKGVNVSALCRERGVSRKTFYKWRARYRAGGLDGLEPASRRPHRSPRRVSGEVEERVVELRKRLVELGADAGPVTIACCLAREGCRPLPS